MVCFLSMFQALDRVQEETMGVVQKLKLVAKAVALLIEKQKGRKKAWRELEDDLQAVTAELVALPNKLDGIFRSDVVKSIGEVQKAERLKENAGGSLHDNFAKRVGILAEMWFLDAKLRPSKNKTADNTEVGQDHGQVIDKGEAAPALPLVNSETAAEVAGKAAAETSNNIECRADEVEPAPEPRHDIECRADDGACAAERSNNIVECALNSFEFKLAGSDIQPVLYDQEVKDAIERAKSRTVSEVFSILKMDEREAERCVVIPERRWVPSLRSEHSPVQGQENIATEISWCTEHLWKYERQELMVHAFALWTFATGISWCTPSHRIKWKPSLRTSDVKCAFHLGFQTGIQAGAFCAR